MRHAQSLSSNSSSSARLEGTAAAGQCYPIAMIILIRATARTVVFRLVRRRCEGECAPEQHDQADQPHRAARVRRTRAAHPRDPRSAALIKKSVQVFHVRFSEGPKVRLHRGAARPGSGVPWLSPDQLAAHELLSPDQLAAHGRSHARPRPHGAGTWSVAITNTLAIATGGIKI